MTNRGLRSPASASAKLPGQRGPVRDIGEQPRRRTLAALVILAAAALILSSAHGLSGPAALAMGWAGFGIALGLPVIIAAWTLPDIDPEA